MISPNLPSVSVILFGQMAAGEESRQSLASRTRSPFPPAPVIVHHLLDLSNSFAEFGITRMEFRARKLDDYSEKCGSATSRS